MNATLDEILIELAPARPVEYHYRDLISDSLWNRLTSRLMKDHPEIEKNGAQSIVDGALGFLSLCANHPGHDFVPSRLVDIGWHTFILYTRDYQDFCERIAGSFIHHEPNDGESKPEGINSGATVRFMIANNVWFDPAVWGVESKESTADCKGDCRNYFGKS